MGSPASPDQMDWSPYYPTYFARARGLPEPIDIATDPNEDLRVEAVGFKDAGIVDIVDIGCGFGGLLVELGPKLPNSVILGMQIYETPQVRMCDLNYCVQAWRFGRRSRIMSRRGYMHCEHSIKTKAYTTTSQ